MNSFHFPLSRSDAEALDARDPLAHCRAAFALPEGITYLVGHSLGPATQGALLALQRAADEGWVRDRVSAWNSANWIGLAEQVGAKLARLIGAGERDVLVCDSVSVNLFKLAASAQPLAAARRLVVEEDEFPTDQYILEGLSSMTGVELVRAAPGKGVAELKGGVLVKSLVNYRTGEVTDVAGDEATAQAGGGLIVWDLSHATGVLDVRLKAWGARLAAGCTYKYLNGGPGAPAFVFVDEALASELASPLPGWMGHAAAFDFKSTYQPKEGVARFAAGTPPILSLAALDGALEIFHGLNMADVQEKARRLSQMCLMLAEKAELKISCPLEADRRGGHISVRHCEGYAVVRAMADWGIEADFRAPDTIRFGLSPLFLSYAEVWDAMQELTEILETRSWDKACYREKAVVT